MVLFLCVYICAGLYSKSWIGLVSKDRCLVEFPCLFVFRFCFTKMEQIDLEILLFTAVFPAQVNCKCDFLITVKVLLVIFLFLNKIVFFWREKIVFLICLSFFASYSIRLLYFSFPVFPQLWLTWSCRCKQIVEEKEKEKQKKELEQTKWGCNAKNEITPRCT